MNESDFPEPASLDVEGVHCCFARARLPAPLRQGQGVEADNLAALIDRRDAFILYGDGVIKVGAGLVYGISDTTGSRVQVTDHGLVKGLDWRAWTASFAIMTDFVIPEP